MRIGLYGMPTSGKTFMLDHLDYIKVFHGSQMLREICPGFDALDDIGKTKARRELATRLLDVNEFIMDGHYSFGDQVVFTESDGQLYDAFLYLYVSPSVLADRMRVSERNRKFLSYDLDLWQAFEIESLRAYCHNNDKDFYVLDNPPGNTSDDISDAQEFIRALINGYSCKSLADRCVDTILTNCKSDTIILMDGDKTLTIEDSSNAVFGYTTHLFDGNFYTGYQSWRQSKEFSKYRVKTPTTMPVAINDRVLSAINDDTFVLTSGHTIVWSYISAQLNVPFFGGSEMSADTKYFVTKGLQRSGKKVIAYGDSMNDYYMLVYADEGYLVTKKDGSLSRSLKQRNIEGLRHV